MVIDVHTHWFNPDTMYTPARWGDTVNGTIDLYLNLLNANLTEAQVRETWMDPDGSRLIQAMDEDGVDMAVVLPIDYGILYGEEAKNDYNETNRLHMELARKYPDRIIPFYGIDPRREGAAQSFAAAMRDWGKFKGLKLYPPCGFFPTDAGCYDLYQVCLDNDIPVLFHGADSGFFSENDGSHPAHIRRVMEKMPQLKIIYAHGGGFTWFDETAELLRDFDNFNIDISAWVLLPPEQLAERMAKLKEMAGNYDKVMYGTDHPVYNVVAPAKVWMAGLNALELSDEERAGIMGENARRILQV